MKLKNLFYLLVAMTLVFAACEKGTDDTDNKPNTEQPGDEPGTGDEPEQPGDEPEQPGDKPGDEPGDEPGTGDEPGDEPGTGDEPGDEPGTGDEPEVKDPVLTLTSNATMEFAVEGGMGEITYTLENPAEGVAVEAETEADWITGLTTAINTKVLFTVTANKGEAREAVITVAYGEQSFEVAVKQAENPVKDPVLTLTSDATMEFAAEGGAGEIAYTLENPAEGVVLTATCEATWVTDIVAAEKVTFVVAKNNSEAREATITVAYGAKSFTVAVKQAEGEPEEEEDENYDPTNVVLTTMGELVYGTYYTQIPLSDDSGNNSLTLILDPDSVVDGYPVVGSYPYWQSDPSYVWATDRFSFAKNSLKVGGTTYSNNDIAYTPTPTCNVADDGTITLTFTVGGEARTFTYYKK